MNKISNMPRKLGEYINSELHDAQLYKALSRSAPNDRDKEIFEEFSDDCSDNAQEFTKLYKLMTGTAFVPAPTHLSENGSYRNILRSRIREEIRLSKKYRREYLSCGDRLPLKRAFFNAYHNALEHAVGIIELCS